MKSTIGCILFPLAVAVASTPLEYLTWAADTHIREGVPKDYHYTTSVLYTGYEAAIGLTQNQTFVNWYRSQIDENVVLQNGTINDWDYTQYSLDDYRVGNNFLWWYNRTGEVKYKNAASVIRSQLNLHPRNSRGGFFHRSPIYANQMWLDGIFMADTFYATWTSLFDHKNDTAWDHIALQFDLIEKHCRNKTSGLLVHGYDESKKAIWADPITGAAPLVWSRGVGWYFIALLEVLAVFPDSHAGKARLLKYYVTLAAALKAHQDKETGGWWLIMNEPYPKAEGNYIESSASAMFTYGLLRGIEEGRISNEYSPAANKGYDSLIERFVVENANGTLRWEGTVSVGSLNSNASFDYYIGVPLAVNDYKGVGPFMWASHPSLHRKTN